MANKMVYSYEKDHRFSFEAYDKNRREKIIKWTAELLLDDDGHVLT